MMLSSRPRLAGLLIGLVLGIASWIGNAVRTNLGIISAFPDLLTLATVPLALYFFVRARVRIHGARDLRTVRKAGWSVVNTAGLVLGVFLASVAGFWFNQWDSAFIASTLVDALVVTVGVGYLSVEIWARLLLALPGQPVGPGADRSRGEH
jgi:hypothetical protein